jgi:electron transfer flavoprotein alpha subunit
MQTRPALGGNIMATICSRNSPCQMATARPGVMRSLPPNPERQGTIIEHPVELSGEDLSLKILQQVAGGTRVDFNTEVILGGGKGFSCKDTYVNLLDELADAITTRFSVRVTKGATRAAVEQGFAERAFQIGQTGTAVSPRLYIAAGISGAIQHMAGVAGSGTIIAINADPAAPVFDQCDYFMVGQAEQLIPELISKLKESA